MPFNGVPFIVLGAEMFECVCGPDRHGKQAHLLQVNVFS